MCRKQIAFMMTIAAVLISSALQAGVSGKIFNSYVFNKDSKQQNAFVNTRAYLGYKNNLTDDVYGKVLLDVQRSIEPRLTAYLKAAYVSIKGVIPKTEIQFGQQGLFAHNDQEKQWGYRYIYKSFMDQNKFSHSADMGVSFRSKVNDMMQANLGVFNGEGYKKPQDSKGKMALDLSFVVTPIEMLKLKLYYGTQAVGKQNMDTIAVFVGVTMEMFRFGIDYVMRSHDKGVKDKNKNGFSISATVKATESVAAFARFDQLGSKDDWNKVGGSDGKTAIAGLEFAMTKAFKLAPTVVYMMPENDDVDPSMKVVVNSVVKF